MPKNNLYKVLKFIKNRFAPRGAKISFAQYGEDLLILAACRKLGLLNPKYIDIGCHHPVFGNNTFLLYEQGSRGIVVEPNPLITKTIRQKRPGDIVMPIGIGAMSGTLPFFTFENRSTRNTFSRQHAMDWQKISGDRAKEIQIEMKTLNEIVTGKFDILCIDAEGYDFEILNAYDWKIKPGIIVVEIGEQRLTDLIQSHGYTPFAETPSNAIFINNR